MKTSKPSRAVPPSVAIRTGPQPGSVLRLDATRPEPLVPLRPMSRPSPPGRAALDALQRRPSPSRSAPPRPDLLPVQLRGAAARAATSQIQPRLALDRRSPRIPKLANLGPRRVAQRMEMVAATTLVVGPTRVSYPGADQANVRSELAELTTMVTKDITYLKSQKLSVCDEALYTGVPDNTALSGHLAAMAESAPEMVKSIVFTAHGSPGKRGKIGMGYDETGKPDYRVDAPQLMALLQLLGIDALRDHRLHFYFRCCNSAYADIDCWKKNPAQAEEAILAQSFIAGFRDLMAERGFSKLSVTGFRGFYFPGAKTLELSTDKKKHPIEDGTVTIDAEKHVTISDRIWNLKNTDALTSKLI